MEIYYYPEDPEICVRCNQEFPGWDRKDAPNCIHPYCKECIRFQFNNFKNCVNCDKEEIERRASSRRSKRLQDLSVEQKTHLKINEYHARKRDAKRASKVEVVKPLQEEEDKAEAVDLQQVESQDTRAETDPA